MKPGQRIAALNRTRENRFAALFITLLRIVISVAMTAGL
jgi:hypothetical protein